MKLRRAVVRLGVVAAMTAGVVAVAVTPSQAAGVGHCTFVGGNLHYSPALDLFAGATTVTLTGTGTGCAGIELLTEGNPLGIAVNSMDITGTFTGTASTLLSNYSGTATVTWHLADNTTAVITVSVSCVLGIAGTCPYVGTITSGTGMGALVEMTPMAPPITNPIGPVSDIAYAELAFSCGPDNCMK